MGRIGPIGRRRRGEARGFSLLEILLILALIAVVAALAVEGYAASVQALAVTAGAEMIQDTLTEARTSAVAQNTEVEVRIYSVPAAGSGPLVYGALQLHWCETNQTTPAVAGVALLPAWVVIDATAAKSPLVGANTLAATPDASDARLNGATRVFHFLPDGSTDLNPATNWFLTVRAAGQSDPAHFPANWACVGLNATTGRAEIYRP